MNRLQSLLRPFLTGLLATGLLVAVMLWVTIDFRHVLFIGLAVFGLAGWANRHTSANPWLAGGLIVLPFALLFITLVLSELPRLVYFLPLYVVAGLLGLFFTNNRRPVLAVTAVLVCIAIGLAWRVIPADIERSLTQELHTPLPPFELAAFAEQQPLSSSELEGQVVVLDFFGTWCAPCRLELPELAAVQAAFAERDDVVFLVVDADIGGDTPEKFQAFIDRTNYPFRFAYDHGGKLFRSLGLLRLGLPALLVIDKAQNIRLQHVGYNAAETNFVRNLEEFIAALLAE